MQDEQNYINTTLVGIKFSNKYFAYILNYENTFVYINFFKSKKSICWLNIIAYCITLKICKYNEHFFIQCIVFLKQSIKTLSFNLCKINKYI